ncbi:carbohydrate kinase family protein [Deefgea rivuli]|uniref:carbohydrate kinase family protein n=1 Tax=Deefgea rivuli TaxID=400948 RepID=UPI000AC365D5|nr:carbohydrate kinase [Deefgea rivuli]
MMPTSHTALPEFIAAGEALTDMIRVDGDQWISKVGGSTWNVARVMAGFGIRSAFAGAVSTDCFGQDLVAASQEAGLDLRFMQQVQKSPLLAMVYSAHPPQYFFVGDDAADLHFNPAQLPEGWQSAVKWVHFGGISLARQPLAATLIALAIQLKAQGVKISYDPNFRVLMDEQYDATLKTMTQLADIIKISDEDLQGLFRSDDIDGALNTLMSWNPQAHYLYTRGAAGASLIVATERCDHPAIDVIVGDTVGAGDASMGGLIYSLMQQPQRSTAEHLRFAIASGAAACQHKGANPPSLASVLALYQQASK